MEITPIDSWTLPAWILSTELRYQAPQNYTYFSNLQTFSPKTIKNIKMFCIFESQSLQFFHTTDA
jgi:hypothetical protein